MQSIEFCAGAGGQALGLEQAGFKHSALVEIEADFCKTLQLNRPQWDVRCHDMNTFDGRPFKGVDLLAGGLPCPPFSIAGKQLGDRDERNLFPAAIRLIDEIRPKAVMIENVKGLQMLTAKPEPAFERGISKETRAIVLDRNGFTCQMCGAGAGEPHPFDSTRKTRLHLGHVIDKSMGGTDDPSNLRAVCSICNEGASNITPDRPSAMKLKAQVRKARGEDQLELLKFLIEKFPNQAKELLE